MQKQKNAIALLITVMFVIVISVAVGYNLKQINEASHGISNEAFRYEVSILLEDVLSILQSSSDLKAISESNDSIVELNMFLSQVSTIPFSTEDVDVMINIQSARAKYNVNDLNNSYEITRLKEFLDTKMVMGEYVDILLDNINGVKVDDSYNSSIFNEEPTLFRDYIASYKHLKKINNFYMREYNTNSLKNVDFKNLFYFSTDKNSTYKIDLNYATADVWELMLGCSKERASELNLGGGVYEALDDLELSNDEKVNLNHFNTSFFEPYLDVSVEFSKDENIIKIDFEYDIKKAKGSNFVYEI